MSGSGVYSIDSRDRSHVVVGNILAASIAKKASPGRNPLTGVDSHPVLGESRELNAL